MWCSRAWRRDAERGNASGVVAVAQPPPKAPHPIEMSKSDEDPTTTHPRTDPLNRADTDTVSGCHTGFGGGRLLPQLTHEWQGGLARTSHTTRRAPASWMDMHGETRAPDAWVSHVVCT